MTKAEKPKKGVVISMTTLGFYLERGRSEADLSRDQVAKIIGGYVGKPPHGQKIRRVELEGVMPDFLELKAMIEAYRMDEDEAWEIFRRTFGQKGIRTMMEQAIRAGEAEYAHRFLDLLIAA